MSSVIYPSKILLFGEYTVLHGGRALAIPNDKYYGQWQTDKANKEQDKIFLAFKNYIARHTVLDLDIDSMQTDYDKGVRYLSTIPIGYGIGSSGAFSAAIYDRYKKNKPSGLPHLRKSLASIEGFFHGESSGIDPLVSFTRQAIYKDEQGDISMIDQLGHPLIDKIALVDSLQVRSSAKYINIYKKKLESEAFKNAISDLTILQDQVILSLVNNTDKDLSTSLLEISKIQSEYFTEMIPEQIRTDWKKGLETKSYVYKLCGAGGGGYFIKITLD